MTEQQAPQEPSARDDADQIAGPIDYLAVEFPGAKLTGEALDALLDLVSRGIIRILDLRVAQVDTDGEVIAAEITDLDGDGTLDLTVFSGVVSGLLDDDDLAAGAALIEPGNAVGLLLYENTWARPFVSALKRADAEVLSSGRIPATDVMAALDELESRAQAATS